jgi:hypothetical protein
MLAPALNRCDFSLVTRPAKRLNPRDRSLHRCATRADNDLVGVGSYWVADDSEVVLEQTVGDLLRWATDHRALDSPASSASVAGASNWRPLGTVSSPTARAIQMSAALAGASAVGWPGAPTGTPPSPRRCRPWWSAGPRTWSGRSRWHRAPRRAGRRSCSAQLLQQLIRERGGGGRVLAGHQVAVGHHVRDPGLALLEVGADLHQARS